MAKELDRILVVDVESTCWDGSPPPGQENEITFQNIAGLLALLLKRLREPAVEAIRND